MFAVDLWNDVASIRKMDLVQCMGSNAEREMATKPYRWNINDERMTIGREANELTMVIRSVYSQRVPFAASFDASYRTIAHNLFERNKLSSVTFYVKQTTVKSRSNKKLGPRAGTGRPNAAASQRRQKVEGKL